MGLVTRQEKLEMRKFIFVIMLFHGYSMFAQCHLEVGVNFIDAPGSFGHNSIEFGGGIYIEPRYAIIRNYDFGIHIGLNGFIGEDLHGGATIPTLQGVIIHRFEIDEDNDFYLGVGAGIYDLRGNRVVIERREFGFAPRLGFFYKRLNLGMIYNFVPNAEFIQLNLGVRILNGR